MSRYIDADAVLELIQEEFHKTDVNGAEQIGVLTCHRIVRTAPTADVVEVVRCKDCNHCDHCYPLKIKARKQERGIIAIITNSM